MGTNERLNDIPHAERRSSQSRSLDYMSPLCQRIVPLFAEYKGSINDIAIINEERSAAPHIYLMFLPGHAAATRRRGVQYGGRRLTLGQNQTTFYLDSDWKTYFLSGEEFCQKLRIYTF